MVTTVSERPPASIYNVDFYPAASIFSVFYPEDMGCRFLRNDALGTGLHDVTTRKMNICIPCVKHMPTNDDFPATQANCMASDD
jgi:hypothetical protein